MALSRKRSREIAFRVIFANTETPTAEIISIACDGETPTGPEAGYIDGLISAVISNLAVIDEIIKTHSRGFAFDRIFKTDLAAMRVAIAEVKFMDTPAAVAVNAAVDIAKRYGTEKSGGFVNGVLAAAVTE